MNTSRNWFGSARFYYHQLLLRHPGWLIGHAVVLFHFLLNYQLGLLFAWLLLSTLPNVSANLLPPHLPISRRRVFGFTIFPAVVVLIACVGVSLHQTQERDIGNGNEFELRESPISFEPRKAPLTERQLSVPAHLWRLSWGSPEPILLPDGQSRVPETLHLVGSLHAYNPYSAKMSDDLSVSGHQLARAMDACCNIRLTPAQAAMHIQQAKEGGLDTLFEAARRVQSLPGSILALEFWATLVVWMLMLSATFAPTRSDAKWRRVVLSGIAIALFGALYFGFVAGRSLGGAASNGVWTPLLVLNASLAQAAQSGSSMPWLCAIVGFATLYWLYRWVELRFTQLELPRRSFGLWGASRND